LTKTREIHSPSSQAIQPQHYNLQWEHKSSVAEEALCFSQRVLGSNPQLFNDMSYRLWGMVAGWLVDGQQEDTGEAHDGVSDAPTDVCP